MSLRLPSQKRFAPTKPKLGARPGGPTVGGPAKPGAAAGFAQPRLPLLKSPGAAAASTPVNTAVPQSRPPEDKSDEGDGEGNAVAGPSRSADTAAAAAPIPAEQILAIRRSTSPVKRPARAVQFTAAEPPRPRSKSPTTAPGGSYLPPSLSSTAVQRSTPSSFRPSASPAPTSIPLPGSAPPGRAPSSSPAPTSRQTPLPRISASPAPSLRDRSVSRAPSLTPSVRSGKRPALIAAAENRSSPLNILPPPKVRRKAELAADAEKELERQSQRGTPAPAGLPPTLSPTREMRSERGTPAPAGVPPSLAAGADENGHPLTLGAALAAAPRRPASSPAPSRRPAASSSPYNRETTEALAEAAVASLRNQRDSATPGYRVQLPQRPPPFLPDDEVMLDGYGAPDELEPGEEDEEYDSDGQPIRKTAAPVQPKKRARAQKGKRAPRKRRKTTRGSGEDTDAELNELDISDDEDMPLTATQVKEKRKRKTRSPVFQPVNLDEAEVGELIGERVDEENMRMGEIATVRSGEGKVSARAKELSVYLRDYQKRNKERLWNDYVDRYERRQPLRRQIRAVRNAKRAQRRDIVAENEGDPAEEVSEDEPDSEEEFDIAPEKLEEDATPEPELTRERTVQYDEDGIEVEDANDDPPEAELVENDDDDGAMDINALLAEDEDPLDERHEDEDFDPELAALGFTVGPSTYRDEDDEAGENGETFEDLYEQIEAGRRTAMARHVGREAVEEEQTGKMPNSRSYAKKHNNERWSTEETEFFYQVLGETGENYTLMSFYFPSRTQRQLKKKGQRENRDHPEKVNEAIRARRPIDPDYLQKTVGYDPKGPSQDADQLLEETRDLPARWAREDTDRALAEAAEVDGVEVEDMQGAVIGDGDKEEGEGEKEEGEEEEEDQPEEEDEEEEEEVPYEEEEELPDFDSALVCPCCILIAM